ncbi:MAG TPA: helix-turn-helix transcriptional regulator [Bellilinea sp.]|nr:helix-turn-helix transcriptional regulator [Bellilinea sp.]
MSDEIDEIQETVADITRQARGDRTLKEFAEVVGSDVTSVWRWENNVRVPKLGFLWERSVNGEGETREWALKCLAALGQDVSRITTTI